MYNICLYVRTYIVYLCICKLTKECLADDVSGKFGNLKVGPGGDAEGSFEIVDTIGQSTEAQSPSASGIKILLYLVSVPL